MKPEHNELLADLQIELDRAKAQAKEKESPSSHLKSLWQRLDSIWLYIALTVLALAGLRYAYLRDQPTATNSKSVVVPHSGDSSAVHGSATVRKSYSRPPDNPTTSNDESNDQPLGHFGTVTIYAENANNGRMYTLDADVDGMMLERIYFPKGGWVDFIECELDDDLQGECEDENGKEWVFHGTKG